MARERLIVLFDGTWNSPEDQTNVYRMARAIRDDDGEVRQRFYYDPGVGTECCDRFLGGATGFGLSENIRQGYDWLARRYATDDEIWVFGFSRGAYTARSLVGMIRKCGLLHVVTPGLLESAGRLYRNTELAPDSTPCREFRDRYSRDVTIHFLGVWDTVGALGIPGTFWTERGAISWHDTALSRIVERAYQAMALDEHREAYDIALWTHPEGEAKQGQLEVEQRWFVGAHADVGGGYRHGRLASLPFYWMQQKAAAAGLALEPAPADDDAWRDRPHDSYREFLYGLYALVRRLLPWKRGRFFRRLAQNWRGERGVNVTVDPSVWRRWREVPGYRPPTLTDANVEPPAEP